MLRMRSPRTLASQLGGVYALPRRARRRVWRHGLTPLDAFEAVRASGELKLSHTRRPGRDDDAAVSGMEALQGLLHAHADRIGHRGPGPPSHNNPPVEVIL